MSDNDKVKGLNTGRRKALGMLGAGAGAAVASMVAPALIRSAYAAEPIKIGVISPLTG